MPPEQVIKIVERTHTHLNHNITLADRKASILLTADVGFLVLYSSFIESNWGSSPGMFKIGSIATLCAALIGISLAGWTVYPRTPKKSGSLMYWGAIQMRSFDEYHDELHDLNDKLAFEEMVNENHNLALVASKKFHHLRLALIATGVMILVAVLSGVAIIG